MKFAPNSFDPALCDRLLERESFCRRDHDPERGFGRWVRGTGVAFSWSGQGLQLWPTSNVSSVIGNVLDDEVGRRIVQRCRVRP